MKKIVVNKCYGGFGLSNKAIHCYAEHKGITLYPEYTEYGFITYWTVAPEHRSASSASFYDYDLSRDDLDLVAVIEELGDKANGEYAKLEIVEIPNDTKWQIEEYDGQEWVAEAHRTW